MKLCQVIAVEKGVKNKVNAETAKLHKLSPKTDLFNGQTRTFKPLHDDDKATLPDENVRVQLKAADQLNAVLNLQTELLNITAQKDSANQLAKADVVVDGVILLSQVPVTFLISLEKNLDDLRTFVDSLPVLDPKDEWNLDDNSGLYRTGVTKTQKTKKTKRPIVLYDATDKHPAQTQVIDEDVLDGHWHKVAMSGAFQAPRKALLLSRVEKLRDAVKVAREAANAQDAPEVKVADKLFSWLTA